MAEMRIRKWEHWQSYRRDRGQPPWIKVHRELMRNPEWVALTDAQRGQLVGMWLLAADRDGVIPASPDLIRKLCYMDERPDLQVFVRLGFIEGDANVTPSRRQRDETEAETEAETETKEIPPIIPQRKASQLSEAWKPTDSHARKAEQEGVSLEREEAKFRNFHLSKASRFVDWDRAFHGWLLKAGEFSAGKPAHEKPKRTHMTPAEVRQHFGAPEA